MGYLKISVQRLFHGFASVRSTTIAKAKEKHQGLRIEWQGEHILVPYERLDEGFSNEETFRSKHIDGQTYSLFDYDWDTFKKTTAQEVQFDIFSSLQRIS